MTIFGKRLAEYVAFAKPFLVLILAVGIARLALSLSGVPDSTARWVSITAAIWIGGLYYAVRVHTTGFGSYKQLLPICFLLSFTAQVIIVPAIILAIFTNTDNIYSIPENYFGSDGKTWVHVAGHLFIGGTTLGPLIGWLVGCVIMFATKKLVTNKDTNATARA